MKDIYSKFDKNYSWLPENILYVCQTGSKSYGTNIEGSDDDFKAISFGRIQDYFGVRDGFQQYSLTDPDFTIFEFRKAIKLLADGNPNSIEMLFVDSSDIKVCTRFGERLLQERDLFITKQVKERFLGYARAQLHRTKLHRTYLRNPIESRPKREDFGLPEELTIPKAQFETVSALMKKEIDKWNPDFELFSEAQKIYLQDKVNTYLSELNIYSNNLWQSAARKLGYSENFILLLNKEKEFESAVKNYNNYQEWKKNRNPKRASLEAKIGYDCYSEDTEFLTGNGWKKFDDINEQDELATVFISPTGKDTSNKKHLSIEYQKYIDKFDAVYNGPMYHFTGEHLDLLVTSNHRMLIQEYSRKNQEVLSDWVLKEASQLNDCFLFLKHITPVTKTFNTMHPFSDLPLPVLTYFRLMGWFLSEGSFAFNSDKTAPDDIRISQKKGGLLYRNMVKFFNKYKHLQVSLYEYYRQSTPGNFLTEASLSVRNKTLVNRLYDECGHKKEKRIPRYVFTLSKVIMETLFDAMFLGDGTKRNTQKESLIYYTSVKNLADDVQELAVKCGWETSIWGPYKTERFNKECEMYQVHIFKSPERTRTLIRNNNVEKINVQNQRVVCFSVPNSTLIIRRNGRVSFQGNCKHFCHNIRLSRMAVEILETGKVNVRRADREELLEIRNGLWPYEKLEEEFEKLQIKIKLAYDKSSLPKAPNYNKIDALAINMLEDFFSCL